MSAAVIPYMTSFGIMGVSVAFVLASVWLVARIDRGDS